MPSTAERAIIGLVGIAIQHIDNGNPEKARDTLTGLIIELEGPENRPTEHGKIGNRTTGNCKGAHS